MIYIFLLLLFVYNTSCEKQDNSDQTIEVLFIGSSYFVAHDLPALFGEFASIMEHEVFIDQSIKSGLILHDHANSLETEFKILERDWDFVILQGVGPYTAYPEEYTLVDELADLKELHRKITLNHYKTKTVFCMPWAFEDGMTWKEGWTDTFSDMQEKIYANTLVWSDEVGFVVSPVGWAWYQVLEEKNYPLHYLHLSDWNHPSLKGSYLMACTVYSTIFQESTSGISHYAGLSEEEAVYFQDVASEIVLDNLSLWNLPLMSLPASNDSNVINQ